MPVPLLFGRPLRPFCAPVDVIHNGHDDADEDDVTEEGAGDCGEGSSTDDGEGEGASADWDSQMLRQRCSLLSADCTAHLPSAPVGGLRPKYP